MKPMWPQMRAEPEAPLVRLGPGGWWSLAVAAALVVALVIAPLTLMALSRDLANEATVPTDATVPGAGRPAAGPPG